MTRPKDPNKPKTILQQKKEFRKRFDSYVNEYTGIGSTRDPMMYSNFMRPAKLSDTQLSDLYHGSDIFSRLAEIIPNEALKQGFKVDTDDASQHSELDPTAETKSNPAEDAMLRSLMMKVDELQLTQKTQQAAIWANVFGGSVMYLGINDGNSQDKPIDLARIQSVDFIKVLDKRYVRQHQVYSNPDHPKYGEVSHYAIRPALTAPVTTTIQEAIIHESRIVVFDGAETATDRKQENSGWCDSVFQRLEEPIKHLVTSFQSVANMMSRSAQGKMKMAGFIDAVAANTPEYIENRVNDMMLRASNNRPFVFDAAEGEDFQLESYSFNGIPQLQELFMLRVCSALRVPYSILFGQSPAGMNSTGDMEVRIFYDQIKNKQLYMLKPRLEYVIRLLMLSKKGPTKGKEPAIWSVCFPSLWQMNDAEKADIEKTKAETKKILIEADKLDTQDMMPRIPTADLAVPGQTVPKPTDE